MEEKKRELYVCAHTSTPKVIELFCFAFDIEFMNSNFMFFFENTPFLSTRRNKPKKKKKSEKKSIKTLLTKP